MERFEICVTTSKKPSNLQIRKFQEYIAAMPIEEVLAGLHFAKKRWTAKDAGVLKVGRKSIIKKEIHSVTSEQAQWRLKNWKMMIGNYRKLGYSYPTISRIKKHYLQLSKSRVK